MNDGHASLRDDFEVSSDELNAMVVCARRDKGRCGAGVTGGGFSGCAVALVDSALVKALGANVVAAYEAATGVEPHSYVCEASGGAEVMFSP